jgi:glutamine---fructose-6-phosphate transaminase (isomerizing)
MILKASWRKFVTGMRPECPDETWQLVEAVRIALTQVVGAYAIVVVSQDHPDVLIAAKKGSPLVIGIGKGEYFIASDASPIVEYTKEVVYLDDEELAVIPRKGKLKVKTIRNQEKDTLCASPGNAAFGH